MPEISADDLHGMHANLTAAGVGEYATLTSDISRLDARIDVARDRILTLTRERDAARASAEEADDMKSLLAADLVKAEARITEAHAALDEAGAPACDGVLSGRITALAADRDQANRFLDSAVKERDAARSALTDAGTVNSRLAADLARTQAEKAALREEAKAYHAALETTNTTSTRRGDELNQAEAKIETLYTENASLRARRNALHDALARMGNALSAAGHHAGFGLDEVEQALAAVLAERDTLRARLAERPAPPDHRDPPVNTAAEEAIERLWGTLYALGGDLDRADFADGIEGIADAVEAALSLNLEQIRTLTDERDHAGRLAMEQFRCRLHRT